MNTTKRDRLALILVLVALPLCGTLLAAQDGEPTVDELIEKNLEAKGGRAALESVESARASGIMTMGAGGQDMEAPFLMEWKAPNKVRTEFTLQGMTGVRAFDGETGWMLMPFMGKTEPEKMTPEDTAMIQEEADFRGRLFDPEEKGYTVEYAGEEEIEGTPTYKLTLTSEQGDVTHYYLDQEYYLEIHTKADRTLRGQDMTVETTISGYKPVGDLILAHSMDQAVTTGQGGMGGGFSLAIEEVELNVDLPDERFTMPEPEDGDEAGEKESGR
ncbi:MAG: LolA family protein [Thermoanaerobaculia bacterium]